ncbi:MAG: hypothetical protein JNM51_10160, partial [Bacteroidia bacterium]|nr:hypothetical protein [Bacteroidia bacterium]
MRKLTFLFIISFLLVACSEKEKSKLPNNYMEERKQFNEVIEIFQAANQISYELPSLKNPDQKVKEKEMIQLINDGILKGKGLSDGFLDFLHPLLNEKFKDNLIKSNELYLEGINENEFEIATSKQYEANKLLKDWVNYLNKNENVINKNLNIEIKKPFVKRIEKIIKPNVEKLSYWRMAGRFIISSILVIMIFSFFLLILFIPFLPFAFFDKFSESKIGLILLIPLGLITGLGQIYFWLLWGGYCANISILFRNAPTVSNAWLYYLTGVFFVTAPLNWLKDNEVKLSESIEERKNTIKGTKYYKFLSIIAFVVFCFYP